MQTLDDIGGLIERQLDVIEHRFGERGIGSALLGVLLAVGVIGGGLSAFVVVLAVLVQFFS